MNTWQRLFKRNLGVLCSVIAIPGLYLLLRMVEVNPLRGDELFSFFHSDFNSLGAVLGNVRYGADNTYLYNGLLWCAAKVFGHTMTVQRLLSLLCWLLCAGVLYRLLRMFLPDRLWSVLVSLLVLFSAQGIFLATDGRMYGLLLLVALLHLYLLLRALHQVQNLSFWITAMLPLIGLLVTPVFFAGQFVLIISLLLLGRWCNEGYLIRQSLRLALGALFSLLVFLVFFHVDYQHSSLLDGYLLNYLRHPQLQPLPGLEFWSIPFRWVLLPHVPGISEKADGGVALIAFAWLGIVTRREWSTAPAGIRLVGVAVLLVLALLMLQLLLHLCTGIPLWAYRYYTALFFFLPLVAGWLLCRYTISRGKYLAAGVLLALGCFRIAGLCMEIPEREQRQHILEVYRDAIAGRGCAVFAEYYSPDAYEMGIYGELYIRYPELRGKMIYAADRGAEWNAWFGILDSLGYHTGIRDAKQFVPSPDCLVLKRPRVPSGYHGYPVLELLSPFAGE